MGEFIDVDSRYRALVLRDLLHHVSGLGDYFAMPEYRAAVAAGADAWSDAELLDRAGSITGVVPGTFHYSNVGFTLVRMVLEAVSRAQFHAALSDLIFTRLGIADTRALATRSDWEHCAEASPATRAYDPHWVYPRTFLATPEALAQALCGVLRGELFDPTPLFESVIVDAPGHAFSQPRYGLGLMQDGARLVGHGGGGPGFALFALALPDGSAAHLEYRVTDSNYDDTELIAAGIACISGQQQK